MNPESISALCLYGRFNNRLSANSGADGAEYIRSQLLNRGQFDVFIYSNDIENEAEIRDVYGDVIRACVFEAGPDFQDLMKSKGIREEDFNPLEGFRTAENTLRFLYGRKRSLELMQKYMAANGLTYVAAVTARFDLGQIDKYNGRHPYRVSEINFNPAYDTNFIYSAMWNQLNAGYADQWFFSSPEILVTLTSMFERTLDYLTLGSTYQQFLESGIPDSNVHDEFSNEMLKEMSQKTNDLVKVPMRLGVNNHLIHKFFFMESGLYSMSRFTSEFDGVAHVLYTHSDYADIWPMYFGQQSKYFQAFSRNYVFVDKYSDEIPRYYSQIIYDSSLPYVDRLLDALKKVPEPVIFFDHEDMVLFDFPDMGSLLDYARVVKSSLGNNSRRKGFDFVRLIRGGRHYSMPYFGVRNLRRLLNWSPWLFSIQPSFWSKDKFCELLGQHSNQHIWEFEGHAQHTAREMRIRGGFPSSNGRKRGQLHWDSQVYPFIATAIVKGRWNLSEYPNELGSLLTEYGIDKDIRGQC